jgi:hypothetical protein
MDTLLHRFQGKVKGVIEGFDRIVFKGFLRPIAFAAGMERYLRRHGVLNKNYKAWTTDTSQQIILDAEAFVQQQRGVSMTFINSSNIRKETLAHNRQKESGVSSGLIGVWQCVESCKTFRAAFVEGGNRPQIRSDDTRCKHLYFYYDHEDLGFMSVRLQTWAPYEIQIALNGREWLRRMLEKEGIGCVLEGNKFFHIDDYELAQKLLSSQVGTQWLPLLNSFLPQVFPFSKEILDDHMSYTWILWQSEWAKDYIFDDSFVLNSYLDSLLRHAYNTGTCNRVLRYLGSPVRKDGQPRANSHPEVATRTKQWYEGARIRHWVDHNSVKMYNTHNVLRFELTMNDPSRFSIYRHTEGKEHTEKKLLPMRKGIADIGVRAKVSSDRVHCFTEHMATFTEPTTVGKLISEVSQAVISQKKRYRGLEATGKDLGLLQAVADPKYNVGAITNKQLQTALKDTAWANGLVGKKLAARISRHLRLLREHGVIKKVPKKHQYLLTDKGRKLTTALTQVLAASIEDLVKLAS